MSAPLQVALALARDGVPVFPCAPDKRPLVAGAFKAARCDADQIRAWWSRWPNALVTVPTGAPSGLVVIDGDVLPGADGRAMLREWTRAGRVPATRTHETRRGGVHLLFRHDPGRPLKCSVGKVARAVDTRGEGGCAIWWPAHGRRVLRAMPLAALPPVPRWIVEAIDPPRPAPSSAPGPIRREPVSDRYAEAALRRAVERVGAAREGSRNDTLNNEVFGLARLIGSGLHASDIRACLSAAAKVAGLPEHEADRTIASALRARAGAA